MNSYEIMKFIKSYCYPFDVFSIKKENIGKSAVYLILNNLNLDFYIGSAVSINDKSNHIYFRFRNHFFQSHKNTNSYLYRAVTQYGSHNFSFHILKYTEIESTREWETYYINKFKPEYNILAIGSDTLDYKHSSDTKYKMKKNYSLERKERIGNLNKGKNLSQYTKNLISWAAKARCSSKEYLDKLSNKFKKSKSKKTAVYDSLTKDLIKIYPSAKELSKNYPVDYRTIRRHLKNGLPINKCKIIVKYYL